MKRHKRIIFSLVLICGVCILGGIGYNSIVPTGSAGISNSRPVVIIDAGHGGLANTID